MHVFVTGATGWIGSATVDELLATGHTVTGLARSDAAAETLQDKGATALLGDLDDLESLRRGATAADAVVHLANKHDWGNPAESDRAERAAVEAMLHAIDGTGKAFSIANGLSEIVSGRSVLETDPSPAVGPSSDRGGSENLALSYAERGVRSIVTRFAPSVHGPGDWGFVNFLTQAAASQGVSGFVGDGSHAWSAVHVRDTARLLRMGLETANPGTRLHAVAEEFTTTRAIAEAIGQRLGLPVVSIDRSEADSHFGFVSHFFSQPLTGSSDLTRSTLGWVPSEATLLQDIRDGAYDQTATS